MNNKRIVMYGVVLMVSISITNLIVSKNQASTPCSSCECWVANDDVSLQVGSVTLHIPENVVVNSLPSTINRTQCNHTFFIPVTSVTASDVRSMMQVLSKNNSKWYTVSLSLEKKPVSGIKVVLTYDPATVMMEHGSFDTLGAQGVSFRLYNKSLIDKLRSNERSLLRIVQIFSPSSVA